MKEIKLLEALTGQTVVLKEKKTLIKEGAPVGLPGNVEKWVRTISQPGQKRTVRTICKWLGEIAGIGFSGGTTIGKRPQDLVLDINHQDGAVTINSEGGITFFGQFITNKSDFASQFAARFSANV